MKRILRNLPHFAVAMLVIGAAVTVTPLSKLVQPKAALAANGDIIVNVFEMDGTTPLVGAALFYNCGGSTPEEVVDTTISDDSGTGGVLERTAAHVASGSGSTGCTDGVAFTEFLVEMDGYVDDISNVGATYHTGAANTFNVTLHGNYELKVQKEASIGAFTGLTNTNFTFGRAATDFSEVGSGVYRFAVPSGAATTISVAIDGYVTNSSTSTSGTLSNSLRDDSASPITMTFAYKLSSIPSESGSELKTDSTSVDTGNGLGTDCVQASNHNWYCPIPLADTALAISVSDDGYVQDSTSLAFTTDRTVATAAQQTATTGAVKYAVKMNVTREGDSAALSGATVAAGLTSCVFSTPSYYCPVPVASVSTATLVVKSGYISTSAATFTDRTANSDAQQVVTVSGVKFGVKVITGTSTGGSLTGVSTNTFRGVTSAANATGSYYFADTAGAGGALVFHASGYRSAEVTNTAFSSITTANTAQVVITLGNYAACTSSPITTSSTCEGLIRNTSGSATGGSSTPTVSNAPTVTFSAPSSGATLIGGTTNTITWTSGGTGVSSIELDISADGGATYTKISDALAASGSYSWSTPNTGITDGVLKVVAYDSGKAVVATDTIPLTVLLTGPSGSSGTVGVTKDAAGHWVAPDSDTDGVSPFDGSTQPISQLQAGWYVRAKDYSSVYYIDSDFHRHVFWDANTFFTYATSFDGIVWVTDATLSTMPLGTPMLPKAGVVLVKVQSAASVYAIENGTNGSENLRLIPDEATAIDLYGSHWADYVIDVDPTIFAKFSTGSQMTTTDSIDSTLLKSRASLAALQS